MGKMLKWPMNIKRCSTSLVIREIQTQATMRHDYTSIRLLKLTSLTIHVLVKIGQLGGFPGGAVVENLPGNAGDTGSSPGLGRSHMSRSN